MIFSLKMTVLELFAPDAGECIVQCGRGIVVKVVSQGRSGQALVRDPECIATKDCSLGDEDNEVFEFLEKRIIPPGSADRSSWDRFLDAEGLIAPNMIPPLSLFSPRFQTFVDELRGELYKWISDIVGALRWRYDISGPHSPLLSKAFEWSRDGVSWQRLPSRNSASISVQAGIELSSEVAASVTTLVTAHKTEPLGHVLWREAWSQRHTNPRSSLVIGFAAAEIGFKDFVSAIVPETTWLVENAPTPPLVTMLKRYLPLLPTPNKLGTRDGAPPSALIRKWQKAGEDRNMIVHNRRSSSSSEDLDDQLLNIKDLLWMLDYLRGHTWALDHLSEGARVQLGLP